MELKEALKTKVVRAYNEYKDYLDLANQQNKVRQETIAKLKESYKNSPLEGDEIEDFSFDIFMIDEYHKMDITILGTRFVNYFRLYKDLPDVDDLDKEIEDTYEFFRERTEKLTFVIDKGKFVETERGFIEGRKKYFEENKLFDKVKGELERILS